MITKTISPVDCVDVDHSHSRTATTNASPVDKVSDLTIAPSGKLHDHKGDVRVEAEAGDHIPAGHYTVHFAGNAECAALVGSNLPITDTVPAYNSPTTSQGDEKPGYVSRDMHEAWQDAQAKEEEEKSDKNLPCVRLRPLLYALAALIGIAMNMAIVYGAYIIIGGFNTISFSNDDDPVEVITDLASNSTDPDTEWDYASRDEYYYMSHPSLFKAAALAGVLTAVPALIVAFVAYNMQQELDGRRDEDECDCEACEVV